MAGLIYPKAFNPTRVPTVPCEVDWSHPLADGLAYLCIPGSPHGFGDITGRFTLPLTVGPGTKWGATPLGPGLDLTAATSGLKYVGTLPSAFTIQTGNGIGSGVTGIYRGDIVGQISAGTVSFYIAISLHNLVNATTEFGIYAVASSNTVKLDTVQAGGTGVTACSASLLGTRRHSLGFTGTIVSASAFTATLYADGASAATGSGTMQTSYASDSTLSIASYLLGSTTGNGSNTKMEMAGWWGVPMSAAQMEWFDVEPFGMLRPRMERTYFIPAVTAPASRNFVQSWIIM